MSLRAGDELATLEIAAVSAEKMKVMALILDDPNPIHFDSEAVRKLGLGEKPINQGPNGVAYVINMLLACDPQVRSVARIKLRFMANTYAGDNLTAGGTVTAIEAPEQIECDVWLKRGDETIVAGNATLLVDTNSGNQQP